MAKKPQKKPAPKRVEQDQLSDAELGKVVGGGVTSAFTGNVVGSATGGAGTGKASPGEITI